jgi:hypothetical protein
LRPILIAALLLTAAPATAAQFNGTDRYVRVHVDDGAAPGADDEIRILDQQGDFNETREVTVDHPGPGAYSSNARADQGSGIGGAVVTFVGSADASGTSDDGGPNATAETFLRVDFSLSVSESFTLTGDYDLVLGNGSVSLAVNLAGGGVSFLSASSDDLFEDHGSLDYAGTIEPGDYSLTIQLIALDENLPTGSDPGAASVALRNFILVLEPVVVPEPGTALLVGLGLLATASRRSRATPRA